MLDLKVFPTPVHVAAIEMVPPSLSMQSLASQLTVVNAMSVDARSTDGELGNRNVASVVGAAED